MYSRTKFLIANTDGVILGIDFIRNHGINILGETGEVKIKDDELTVKIQSLKEELENIDNFLVEYKKDSRLTNIIYANKELFSEQNFTTNQCKKNALKYFHHIETVGNPIAQKARPLTNEKLIDVKEQFRKLEKNGIIERSDSPYATPIHLVPKKDTYRIRRKHVISLMLQTVKLFCEWKKIQFIAWRFSSRTWSSW